MRRAPAELFGLAAALALLLTPALAGHAAATHPVFTTPLLPGSSGSSEPRAAVSDKGVHWITTNATSGEEEVYRSTDGVGWHKVTRPGNQTAPTTDVDVVVLPSGRVLTSELDFAGINFITHYSDDEGKTWVQSQGNTYADTDRQWYAVGPRFPGEEQPRVYMLFHNLLSGTANHNMFVATSHDGGASFGVPVPVTIPPQQDYLDLQCADSGGPSNIFVDQRTGKVSVVFGSRSSPIGGCAASPVEVNVVAANRIWVVSADADKTETLGAWTPSLAVDDTAKGRITGMQLAPGAVGDDGTYYVAYPESLHDYPDYDGAAIKVVHSKDLKTWSAPIVVAPPGGTGNILPHIVAGSAGRIGLAWYHGNPDKTWSSYAGQVLDALSATPHVTATKLSDVVVEKGTASSLMGACLSGQTATLNGFYCGRSTDVNGIAMDRCGRLLLTWPAQAGLKDTDGTYASQQVDGPRLRTTVCATSVTPPKVVPPGSRGKPGGGSGLAATGASTALAAVALLFLGTGIAVRRRRIG
jgi:hypothetical protein